MKNKTLKKILCFLLAFVVMISTPLNLQANAVAVESWVIWGIVTYLTSIGLIFTASGAHKQYMTQWKRRSMSTVIMSLTSTIL